ncbi:MAG: ABC transporter ATP-binding protein [FCB group bacterium]
MSKEKKSDSDYKPLDIFLFKRLLVFIKPYRKYVYFAIVLTIISAALSPLLPYLTKIGIDKYITKSNLNGLLKMVLIITGLLVFNSLIRFGMTYLMQWVGQKILYDIRIKVYQHIQNLSLRFYDTNPVGRLVTRVTNDIEALNEMFSSGVVMIIADVLLIVFIIAFMLYTNKELTFFTLTILPVLILATSVFRKKVRVTFRDIRLKISELNSFLNEFITGISTIKLFTQEKNQTSKFNSINEIHKNLWVRTVFYYALFFPTVEMLSAIALGIILWFAAGNILTGLMTVGTLIAFTQYSEMFFRPIRDLTEKYTTLQSAMAAAERIFTILDTTESLPDSEKAVKLNGFINSLEFKNVSFSYDNSKWVLNDVSFEIKKGETVAIVGATGAGKTSIINLLNRFYEFQNGDILFDGTSIRDIKQESLREHIALVMQDVFLFSRTISDNISLGKEDISTEEIKNSAIALGAYDFINRLTDNFQANVTEGGSTLSSGQRQLISFCRAYSKNPQILILDEATSNIDSETEQIIEKSLNILLEGRTSLIIAHRLSTIKRADKIIVLHKGTIRETGTHKELLALGGLYAKLYRLQYQYMN